MKRFSLILTAFVLVSGIFLLQQCRGAQEAMTEGPVNFDPGRAPYANLSEYAFFAGKPRQLQPNERVVPYDLITPLFTDYAHKSRFVWMPDSVQATVLEDGRLDFPDNTVLIKNFYYPADFSRPEAEWDIIETRLLLKRSGKWDAYTYIWNEGQTDAKLNLVGDFRSVHWKDEKGAVHDIQYVVPNKNQCKGCHNLGNKFEPVGPKVRNLNRDITYADGAVSNQLVRWQKEGLLAAGDYTARFAPVADWNDPSADLEARALAYLDVNCGHCHNPDGPAHTTGLFLAVDYQQDRTRLGFCKTPVAAGKGSGNLKVGIAPGQPDSSILVFRMESIDPGIMMPEVGRVLAHPEGIDLIRQWIEETADNCQ